MLKTFIKQLVVLPLLLSSTAVLAATYHFLPINPNNNNIGAPNSVGNQLTLDVINAGPFATLFRFSNPVGISSSIVKIYFSDPAPILFTSFAIVGQSLTGVNFALDTNPANFPEGGPSFIEVASADAAGGGVNEIPNGINAIGEFLDFAALYSGSNNFESVISAINAGDFKIGLQTRDNPRGGNPSTDRWLNATPVNAVPLPAAAWLFGSALLGFIGLGRRRI